GGAFDVGVYLNGATVGAKFDPVVEKLLKYLGNAVPISVDRRNLRDLNLDPGDVVERSPLSAQLADGDLHRVQEAECLPTNVHGCGKLRDILHHALKAGCRGDSVVSQRARTGWAGGAHVFGHHGDGTFDLQ